MSFEDELSSVVADIRTEAVGRYEFELGEGYTLTEDRTAVRSTGMRTEAVDVLNSQYRTYLSYLDALEREFASFYELRTAPLAVMRASLGGPIQERGTPSISALYDGAVNDVCSHLHFAEAEWITPLAEEVITDPVSPNQRFHFWSGAGATAFNDRFLVPFRAAAERQIAYAGLLTIVVEIFRNGVNGMQDDLLAIARACRDEMASYHNRREVDAATTFTIVGVAATTVALFPVGTTATVLLGITSIAASGASMEADARTTEAPSPEWVVEGADVTEVVLSTFDAIAQMRSLIAVEDAEVARLLNDLANANPGTIERPEVADRPQEFGAVDSIDPHVVVAEVEQIYRAGFVSLPAAAAQYARARRELDTVDTPASIRIAFLLSRQPFNDARENLSDALNTTRDQLTDTGATLVQVATTYEWTDDASAAEFNLLRERVEPPPLPTPHRPARTVF